MKRPYTTPHLRELTAFEIALVKRRLQGEPSTGAYTPPAEPNTGAYTPPAPK